MQNQHSYAEGLKGSLSIAESRSNIAMEREEIPEDVLRFIENRIDSVPHLEALLLMWDDSVKSWTEEEISTRIYVTREQARVILQALARHGIVAAAPGLPGSYQYNVTWDEAQIVPKVATIYRRHLVQIATVIHSKASSAVRAFARAFQLKSKD